MVTTRLRHCLGLCGWVLVAALFQGCATTSDPEGAFADVPGMASAGGNGAAPAANPSATPPAAGDTETEIIRRGESLTITFTDLPPGAPAAPFEDRVKEDGTITLFYNQVFVAAGKSRGQLEKEIRDRYVPRYFVRLTVTIVPKERSYTIGGEVKASNRYTWFPGLTVLKAIQSAGDFTDFANKKRVQVTRGDGRKTTVNCAKAISDQRYDIPIYPGDTIHVPRKLW